MGLYTRINMVGRRFRNHTATFQRTYTTLTVPLKEDSPCFPFVVSRRLSIYYNLVDYSIKSFKLLMSPQLSVKHSTSNPIQGPSSGESNIEFSTEVISVDQRPFGHSTVLGNLRIRAQWLSLTSFQDETQTPIGSIKALRIRIQSIQFTKRMANDQTNPPN
jgi:hypothetical protein